MLRLKSRCTHQSIKRRCFFPEQVLRSIDQYLPDSKDRIIPQGPSHLYTDNADLTLDRLLRHPSGRDINLEDPEDFKRLVLILCRGTPHAVIRGGDGLPACD